MFSHKKKKTKSILVANLLPVLIVSWLFDIVFPYKSLSSTVIFSLNSPKDSALDIGKISYPNKLMLQILSPCHKSGRFFLARCSDTPFSSSLIDIQ